MAKKVKNDYFKMIEQQVGFCVEAASLLEEILKNYSPDTVTADKDRIHEIENNADTLHHDIINKLTVEFITPIDQEDILGLVQIIDDITDALDEIVLELYMYHIDVIPSRAPEVVKLVSRCIGALHEAAGELRNFKKPEKLRALLVKVNTIESDADNLFVEAIHHLFATENDAKKIIGHKAIYERLEKCCDLCEHAADAIEQIILKNT